MWSRCFVFSFFFSSSLVLVFGVVRAQLCEHARYPRTPPCSSVPLSSSFFCFPPFLHAPPFCVWNGGGGDSPCVRVFGGHDGYG